MASRHSRQCPTCGRLISPTEIPTWESGGFPCPGCGRRLQTSVALLKLTVPCGLAMAFGLSFYLGFRGFAGAGVALLASIPLCIIVLAILSVIFPPSLRLFPGAVGQNPDGSEATQSDQTKDRKT